MKKVKKSKKQDNKTLAQHLTTAINEDGVIKIQALLDVDLPNVPQSTSFTVNEAGMIMVKPPADQNEVVKTVCKKVKTFDLDKKQNGFLIELFKEGRFTTVYLSATAPGGFKGYHLHKVREANYVCLKGKIKVILYTAAGREEHILTADGGERLHIPANVPTGLSNEWEEEAWVINNPSPAYDPELKGEQVDFTEEQCERGEYPGATRRVKWGSDSK